MARKRTLILVGFSLVALSGSAAFLALRQVDAHDHFGFLDRAEVVRDREWVQLGGWMIDTSGHRTTVETKFMTKDALYKLAVDSDAVLATAAAELQAQGWKRSGDSFRKGSLTMTIKPAKQGTKVFLQGLRRITMWDRAKAWLKA